MSELFGRPFCISILRILSTQFLRHPLDFNAFSMVQEYFSQSLEISTNQRGGPNFCGGPILKNAWIIWSPLLYFNFKSFMDTISSSVIRFQCILHDSEVLFSEFWDFYKLKRGDAISGENQFCRRSELFGPPLSISKCVFTCLKFAVKAQK